MARFAPPRRVDWPVVTVAVALLIVVVFFGRYLENRQRIADTRADKQRQAICAILVNIPADAPPSIVSARRAFARDGHPRDCQPIVRVRAHATPRPTPTVTTTAVVPQPGPTRTVSPEPAPTVTRTATPRPIRTPTPSPTPSPSRTCVLFICT